MSKEDILIDFAGKLGELKAGLASLKTNFSNHIKQHRIDRIMQWLIIALQTVIIAFLAWLKQTGKI